MYIHTDEHALRTISVLNEHHCTLKHLYTKTFLSTETNLSWPSRWSSYRHTCVRMYVNKFYCIHIILHIRTYICIHYSEFSLTRHNLFQKKYGELMSWQNNWILVSNCTLQRSCRGQVVAGEREFTVLLVYSILCTVHHSRKATDPPLGVVNHQSHLQQENHSAQEL